MRLAVAARIVGAELQLDRSVPSNVAVCVATRTVVVECKRSQSEDALERDVNDARHQLRKRYKSANRPGSVEWSVDGTAVFEPEGARHFKPRVTENAQARNGELLKERRAPSPVSGRRLSPLTEIAIPARGDLRSLLKSATANGGPQNVFRQ
jgi:hypothetical protein